MIEHEFVPERAVTSSKGVEYEATPQVVEHHTGPNHTPSGISRKERAMTHSSARPLQWIQRYEITLNTMAMEQLEAVNQGIRDGLTSVIDGAYQVYELLDKHRYDVLFGEDNLSYEDRVSVDTMIKFRMDGDV